tara:strand:+ start:775 stop:1113 length:339 start_codon:yes stop_codon:yes gene_type:complete
MLTEPGITLHIGLAPRHDMRTNDGEIIDKFIFDKEISDVHNYEALKQQATEVIKSYGNIQQLFLYATGLVMAVTNTLRGIDSLIDQNRIGEVYVMHFDRDTGKYGQEPWHLS